MVLFFLKTPSQHKLRFRPFWPVENTVGRVTFLQKKRLEKMDQNGPADHNGTQTLRKIGKTDIFIIQSIFGYISVVEIGTLYIKLRPIRNGSNRS